MRRPPSLLRWLAVAAGAAVFVAGLGGADSNAPLLPPAPKVPPPPNRVFEARLDQFGAGDYARAIEALLAAYEKSRGRSLAPGPHGRVGLKVYSDSGAGLSTPPDLVRAVVASLERRGFARKNLFLVGLNAAHLRDCGFLPALSVGGDTFEGLPVVVLESGRFYDPAWYYDSPLPSQIDSSLPPEEREQRPTPLSEADRKSFLPMPLLFDLDFWINLPACTDHPVVGVNGVLANGTLWNASNTQRFFRSPATAPAAVAEMAAIPELRRGRAFAILSLERYQFIGGPIFNSLYTLSEPLVWLSEDEVILDALMRARINIGRRAAGFRELPEDLRLIAYADQLGLGSGAQEKTDWVRVGAAAGEAR